MKTDYDWSKPPHNPQEMHEVWHTIVRTAMFDTVSELKSEISQAKGQVQELSVQIKAIQERTHHFVTLKTLYLSIFLPILVLLIGIVQLLVAVVPLVDKPCNQNQGIYAGKDGNIPQNSESLDPLLPSQAKPVTKVGN